MRHVFKSFGFVLCCGLAAVCNPVFGLDDSVIVPAESSEHRLLLGDCELSNDPSIRTPKGPLFCVRGKAGLTYVLGLGSSGDNRRGGYVDSYLGVYLTSWLSLSGRARAYEFYQVSSKEISERYIDQEYSVIQLGNPVLHRVRLTAGHMRPPFGIDRVDVDEFYRLAEDRRFWPGPTQAFSLTFDDLRATELNIGWGSYAAESGPAEDSTKVPSREVTSLRFMRDFAGNGSTRLLFSGAVDSSGARHYGTGIVNISQSMDQFVFEVVRRLPRPDGSSLGRDPVTQIMRIGYTGAFVRDARWVFHFDDEKSRFRRGIIEFNQRFHQYLIVRLGVSYNRDLAEVGRNRWYLISGFEGRL